MKFWQGLLIFLALPFLAPVAIVAIVVIVPIYFVAYPLVVFFIWCFTNLFVNLLRKRANLPLKIKSTPWEIFQGK